MKSTRRLAGILSLCASRVKYFLRGEGENGNKDDYCIHGSREMHRDLRMNGAGGSERQRKNRDVDAIQGKCLMDILRTKERKRQQGPLAAFFLWSLSARFRRKSILNVHT